MEILRKLCKNYNIVVDTIKFNIDAYIHGDIVEQLVKYKSDSKIYIKTINLAVNCLPKYFTQIAEEVISRINSITPDISIHTNKMLIDYRDFTIEIIDINLMEIIVNTDKLLWNGDFCLFGVHKSKIEIEDLKHCVQLNYCRIQCGMQHKKERIFQLLQQGKFIIEWHYFIEVGEHCCVFCRHKKKTGHLICCRAVICHDCASESIEHDTIKCKNCKKETKML
jgi:hypothetical protein